MQIDTKVETDNVKVDFITPTFSGLETESISESASLSEFESENSRNKNGFSLFELANSRSVKTEEGELIDCGSTAGGPHLNGRDLRRAYRLRR